MRQFELLGIEPTRDVAEIRRAYAEKSKSCHPEDDPEGFQALYSAYQWALARAKRTTAPKRPPEAGREADAPQKSGPVWKNSSPYLKETRTERQQREARRTLSFEPEPRRGGQSPLKSRSPQAQTSETLVDYDALFQKADAARRERLEQYRQSGPGRALAERLAATEAARKPDWQAFFLSEEFLDAQYDEAFLEFFADWLGGRPQPVDRLPHALTLEWFIAYSFPSYTQGRKPPLAVVPLFELAAPLRRSDSFARELSRKEYAPRRESFALYNRLLARYEAGQRGALPPEDWAELLEGANSADSGPCRHPSLYRLLAHFVRRRPDLPGEVCALLFRTFDLEHLEGSSLKQLAQPLYDALRERSGDIREELRRQRLARAELLGLKESYHDLYCKFKRVDPQNIAAFFADAAFLKLRLDPGWLDYLSTLYRTSDAVDDRLRHATQDAYRADRERPEVRPLWELLDRYRPRTG